MKKYYQQDEDTMRKSFQQQLSDAIAVIRGMYKKFFEIEEEKAALHAANIKMNVLAKKLKEKEENLKDLRNELEQYEESGIQKDNFGKEASSSRPTSEKELMECKTENKRLLQVIAMMEGEAQMRLKENSILEDEIICLKEIADQDQRTIQKLMDSKDRLRYELDCEKLAIQDMINTQKEDIEIRRKYASISAKRTTKGRESAFYSRPSSGQSKSMTPVTESQHFMRPPSASLGISPKLKKKLGKGYIGAALMPTPAPAAAPAPGVPVTVVATPTVFTRFLARSEKAKHTTFLLPHMVPEEVLLNLQMFKKVKPLFVHSSMNLTESSSATNTLRPTTVKHNFVDIPSDQVTFTHLPKAKSFRSQEKRLEKSFRHQHIPGRRAEPHN